MGLRAVLTVCLLLVLTACGDDDSTTTVAGPGGGPTSTAPPPGPYPEERRSLDEARQRWADADISDYTYRYTELCFCPPSEWVVRVADGAVTGQEPAPGTEPLGEAPEPRTMEQLFDVVEEELLADPAAVELSFDEQTGALERYWVDVDERMVDEERGLEVLELLPAGAGGSPVPELDLAALSEDWGCGYGFHAGDPQQTVALWITGDEPLPVGTIGLPDPRIDAAVLTGSDLYANWCDDVMEPGEPEPEIDRRLPIVMGTVTIEAPADPEICSGAIARLVAQGLVVELPDGTTRDLGGIEITNDAYGCFAG